MIADDVEESMKQANKTIPEFPSSTAVRVSLKSFFLCILY